MIYVVKILISFRSDKSFKIRYYKVNINILKNALLFFQKIISSFKSARRKSEYLDSRQDFIVQRMPVNSEIVRDKLRKINVSRSVTVNS